MMLSLGLFVFMRQTMPYQNMNRNIDYRWPTNSRIGLRPAAQFLGVDSEKITLSGVLLPELTGGKLSLLALELMAAQGKAWSLIEGTGTIYGMFVIESLNQTRTLFFADGSARRIEFTLNLLRVDESLTAMFGDLQQQRIS
ncbi:TPA: phage tail protein [Yersinia enterocolitica]|nr:phage tail protein [Yersinia enterocolitica]